MNMHHSFTPQADQSFTDPALAEQAGGDCITIIARSPGQAIAEFHRRGLNKDGYAICGRIVPHKFELLGDDGEIEQLFGGDHFYSATFARRPRG